MLDVLGALLLVLALGSGALLHRRALAAGDLKGVLASLACVVVALALAALAFTSERTFARLMQEDGPAEWATVFAFVVAAALYGKRALADAPWLTRAAFVSVALFCVFVAGEEISWGQRLFAIEPPAVFLEHNFQQELNVHNLLTNRAVGGIELDTRNFVALLALFYGGLLPLARARLLRSSNPLLLASGAVAPHALTSTSFLLVAAAELAYPVSLTGEAAELLFGCCFVASGALALPSLPRFAAPALVAGALVLGAVAPATIDRLWYGSDEARVALARQELHELAAELQRDGVLQERALQKKKSVHKRVFTAGRAGYFSLPDETDEQVTRRRWFLDPWNNPYWIAWSRKQGRITLYSFGPDRRRDGRYEKRPEVKGDDIAVHFEAPWVGSW